MAPSSLRVVGEVALPTLLAYGATLVDLRRADGGGGLPSGVPASAMVPSASLPACAAYSEPLVLLLVNAVADATQTAARLQAKGRACVVVVSAGPALDATAPAETPG